MDDMSYCTAGRFAKSESTVGLCRGHVQMIEFLRQNALLLLAGIFILVTASLKCAWVLRSRRRSLEWERERNKSVQALIVRLIVNNAISQRLPLSEPAKPAFMPTSAATFSTDRDSSARPITGRRSSQR